MPTPSPTTIPEGHCEENFVEFQGYCYKISTSDLNSGEAKDWSGAKDSCKNISAELASVHSAKEAAKLTTMLVDLPDPHGREDTRLWIGFLEQEYSWQWSDETRINFLNWAPNEPSGYVSVHVSMK